MGHEDSFPRPRLSARCRFSHGTFAGTRGNGRDAPIPAIGLASTQLVKPTEAVGKRVYDLGDALGFLAVTVEALVDTGSAA
jgi:hypothetical protein